MIFRPVRAVLHLLRHQYRRRAISRADGRAFGERNTINRRECLVIVVFLGYATTTSGLVAGGLFILDGVFFTLTMLSAPISRIADPADNRTTASVASRSITSPRCPSLLCRSDLDEGCELVFQLGALMAAASLLLAFLVPREPLPGRETVWTTPTERTLFPAE